MNTSFIEEYKKWIEKLSKENFDELILNYFKEYYNTRDAYITNGPYDGGIDLVYSKDGNTYKRNIQITIQEKGLEGKLGNDLRNAKKNFDKYNYLNTLDFYYKFALSPEKKKKLIKEADTNYQITLKIIDANELAGLAEEYKSIRNTILKFSKAAFPESSLNIDKNTKILFDVISMGKDATAIKHYFVQSIILSFIYQKESASVEEIYNGLREAFFNKYDRHFFETEIGKLKEISKVIDLPNITPKQFRLTDKTHENLSIIDHGVQIQESELIASFKVVLNRYSLENETENVFKYIIDLYNANYVIDECELLNEASNHQKKIQQIFTSLINYLQRHHGITQNNANEITRQLLVICSNNEFLNKTSISKMFTNLFKSDKLDTYLSTSKRKVYFDTQILLQTICCNYIDIEYEDQLYKAVKYLMKIIEDSSIPICLYTTIGYVSEVTWHLLNGLNLERFLDLDFIKDLGPSKNVFFNYFLEIREVNGFESFAEFIEDLLDVNPSGFSSDELLAEELIQNFVERLELLNISVVTPPKYENYDKYRRQYEISLSYLKHDQKSYEARKNDLNTILHLSEMHYDVESGYFEEPFFVTWDSSFYEVRKDFKKFKELNHWYLYPPMKFANTISVLNMKIDSTAINYNIVAMVEENFNSSNDTISFLDLVSGLVDNKDVKKWKLISKLAKLRRRLIQESNIEDFSKVKNKSLPIDELLLLIQKFYQNPSNSRSYPDLTSLLLSDAFAERISDLIENNITNFEEKHKIKMSIIEALDMMIVENKLASQDSQELLS